MWGVIYIIYTIIGLILILLLILKPRFIKPTIIAILIGASGLVIHGRLLVDKYFMAVIAFVITVVVFIDKLRFIKKPQKKIDILHQGIFFLMIVYFIFQTLRSALVYSEIRYLVWIIYFVILGIISFFLTHNNLPKLNIQKISLIIVASALFYFSIYLAAGYTSEKIRGISRWSLQGYEWPQTVNAAFMLVIALPAAIFLFKSKTRWHKILSIALFIVASISANYYGSNASWMTILSFLIVAPTIFSFRKTILWFFILFAVIALLGVINKNYFNQVVNLSQKFIKTVLGIFRAGRDVERYIHLHIPFRAIGESPIYALFGYGIDSYKTVLIPYVEEEYNIAVTVAPTTGFSALLVDTGLIGLLLLFLNFIFVARKIIIKKNSPGKIILLTSLSLTAMWLPVTQVLGVILFYFMIMPGGLLIQLNEVPMSIKS